MQLTMGLNLMLAFLCTLRRQYNVGAILLHLFNYFELASLIGHLLTLLSQQLHIPVYT